MHIVYHITLVIERILLVFNTLKFKEETIQFLTDNPTLLGITNRKALTLQNLQALTFYQKLITLAEDAEPSVQSILTDYQTTRPHFPPDSVARLADLWEQDQSLFESLHRSLTLPSVPIEALQYLEECLQLCQTLGINGYSLQNLAQDENYDALTKARDIALGAFSSKYDDETIRAEKLEPYQDRINVKKRDALCDYILAWQDYQFNDLNEVYALFLLDVEMSGCFRTSRLVCGISSLQLYIHRCLVNLEQSAETSDLKVDPTLIPANEWEWRKNYRVWEANRKVFLYPENYLEPDLRDNKTPLFKELEDELLQQKITKESAEAAYKKYLTQFSELGRLRIAGSYYHAESKTYYFFGRSQQDPYQYYYRKWINNKVWTHWEKIDLAINSEYVAAIVRMGKLFVFWVELRTQKQQDGSLYEFSIDVLYSWKEENGKWIAPQRLELTKDFWSDHQKTENEKSKYRNKLYPELGKEESITFSYSSTFVGPFFKKIDFFANITESLTIKSDAELYTGLYLAIAKTENADDDVKAVIFSENEYGYSWHEHDRNRIKEVEDPSHPDFTSRSLTNVFDDSIIKSDIDVVHNKLGDYILKLGNQQYLVNLALPHELLPYASSAEFTRLTFQLTISTSDKLNEILVEQGLDGLMSLDAQRNLHENYPEDVDFIQPRKLRLASINLNHLDFLGPYGTYYRELYFHIPFLIANHLNANQRFKEAKWWYERIFDPTAGETPASDNPTDRNWRYIEFRDLTLEKLKDILVNSAAIQQYKEDPFSPYAIARLRMGAFQKAVVMKYIDNLLDWGDYLFAQDTMESINEATMLYVLAFDILGERPPKLGPCPLAPDEVLTYEQIGPSLKEGSEFLTMLESWHNSTKHEAFRRKYEASLSGGASSSSSGVDIKLFTDRPVDDYDTVVKKKEEHTNTIWK